MEQPIRYTMSDIIAVRAIMIISIILESSGILLPWLRKYQINIANTLSIVHPQVLKLPEYQNMLL